MSSFSCLSFYCEKIQMNVADYAGTLNLKERASEREKTEWNSIKQLNEHFKAHIFCWCELGFSVENICRKTWKIVHKWDKIARNCFNCLCILMKIRFFVSVTVLCEILSQNPLLLINFFWIKFNGRADKKIVFFEI